MLARAERPYVVAVALVMVVGAVAIFFALRGSSHPTWTPQVYDYKSQPPLNPGGVPLRPMDVDIFTTLEKGDETRAQLLDLFPDRPYHVKLVGNGAERRIEIVLVDLHRSGHWNERWMLKPDGVKRYTLGGDDETPEGVMWTMRAGHWIPH